MTVDKKINVLRGRKLSLDGAMLIGSGANANVYLLPDDNVVKVLFSTDFNEAEKEIQLSKWAFAKGIPTAISYDVADVDGHPGLVYESLGRGNLRNELKANPDSFNAIMQRYMSLIKTINAITVTDGQLPSKKQSIVSQFDKVKCYFNREEYNKGFDLLNTIPDDNHVIHGDCHIKNVKVLKGQFYLIDLNTLSVGDPIFELMGLCCCYHAYVNVNESGYNDFFDIDDEVIKNIYSFVLDNYYQCISAEDKQENIKKIELLTYIYMLNCLSPDGNDPKNSFDAMLAKVKQRLFTLDNLILKR